MSQARNLLPVSVYVSPEALQEADVRAGELGVATATLLRMILLGTQPPLNRGST